MSLEKIVNVDDYIMRAIGEFEDDVRERYADPSDGKAVWTIAERVAEVIHQDVESFATQNDGYSWADLRAAMKSRDMDEELDFALQSRFAIHLAPAFEDVADRCWHLTELLQPGNHAEAVVRFMGRVARCYLLGLVPECIIMCRGALENGVSGRLAAESINWPRETVMPRYMKDKLRMMEKEGWLKSVSASQLMSDVWQRANKAVHNDPLSVGNALEAIRLTALALNDLKPAVDEDAA